MSKIPVSDLWSACEMMLRDKWGYIWGTAGVKCTQAVINTAIERHPSTAEITKKYGPKWLGHMVTDCSGVMVYIWRQHGKTIPHGSSSMVSKRYIVDCSDTPHPGYAAFVDPTPETDDNNHIGIVSEDGKYVYEAKGTQYGFVKTPIGKSEFNKFGRFKDVDYEATEGKSKEQGGDLQVIYSAEVVTQSGSLNIRSGPGANYRIIGSLAKGEIVDVLEEQDGWAHIIDGKEGWASLQYLKRLPDEPTEETPTDDRPNEEEKRAEWLVVIPCESETEARDTAKRIEHAVIVCCEKPPDAKGE